MSLWLSLGQYEYEYMYPQNGGAPFATGAYRVRGTISPIYRNN
jgi:hypothetical protein